MTQRPDLFQLDRNHPLAKGLVFAGLGFGPGSGAMFDASLYKNNGTLTNMTPSTDWVFIPELGRWGLQFGATGPKRVSIGEIAFPVGSTFATWMRTPATLGAYEMFAGELGTPDHSLGVRSTIVWLRTNGSGEDLSWTTTISASTLYHIAIRRSDAATYEAFKNGVSLGTQAGTREWAISSIGNAYNNASYYFEGQLADPLVLHRALTPNEIADLADPSNVYLSGLIAGRPRRRYVFLGGGSTVEINATLASLELTGNAAGVSVGTTFTATAGAVELSGLAASVSSGTDVAATTAACEATSLDATVSAGTTFTAGTGAIAATGLAADVSILNAIEASTGAVELTGLAADVSVGVTLTATTGAMTASGLSATVSTGDSIECTTGAVELSGLAGTVSAGTTLTASTGAASISGLAADVSLATTITGSLATLVAAALAADVSATVSIEASTPAMEWIALPASVSTESSVTRQLFFGIKTGGAL